MLRARSSMLPLLIKWPLIGHGSLADLQPFHALQLLRTSEDKPLNGRPLWERSDLDAAQLVNEFQKECHVLRRSIDGDLVKVLLNTARVWRMLSGFAMTYLSHYRVQQHAATFSRQACVGDILVCLCPNGTMPLIVERLSAWGVAVIARCSSLTQTTAHVRTPCMQSCSTFQVDP